MGTRDPFATMKKNRFFGPRARAWRGRRVPPSVCVCVCVCLSVCVSVCLCVRHTPAGQNRPKQGSTGVPGRNCVSVAMPATQRSLEGVLKPESRIRFRIPHRFSEIVRGGSENIKLLDRQSPGPGAHYFHFFPFLQREILCIFLCIFKGKIRENGAGQVA